MDGAEIGANSVVAGHALFTLSDVSAPVWDETALRSGNAGCGNDLANGIGKDRNAGMKHHE